MAIKFKRITDLKVAEEYAAARLLLCDREPLSMCRRGDFYYSTHRSWPRPVVEGDLPWVLTAIPYQLFIALED